MTSCQKALHFWRQKNVWIPQKSKKNSLLILRESIFWVSMKKIKGGGKKAEILSNPEIREKKKTEKPNVEKEFLSSLLCSRKAPSVIEIKSDTDRQASTWEVQRARYMVDYTKLPPSFIEHIFEGDAPSVYRIFWSVGGVGIVWIACWTIPHYRVLKREGNDRQTRFPFINLSNPSKKHSIQIINQHITEFKELWSPRGIESSL